MSAPAAAVHADWLALVEPHGQFLTLPVLRRAMPDGLPRTPDHIRLEARERAQRLADDDGARTVWLEFLLRDALAWGPHLKAGVEVPDQLTHTVAEHHVILRPEYALLDPGTGAARVLIERYPHGTRLDQRLSGEAWAASPIERTALLCRATGVPLGVCTDARHLVLVWAPFKEAGGHATWDTALFAEGAEVKLLDALVNVLGARRLFAAAIGDQLEDLMRESGSAQEELTRTLGHQVRQAVELLVAAISRADLDSGSTLLHGIAPHTVYEASCTVLMRLVFLLYAEERGLLRLGEPVYDANYAISTLREQLVEVSDLAGDEPLELRTAAWHRLLATFRAVHGGISHDRLRLPAYGGTLFDPDRYPFLEGRTPAQPWHTTPARPLPVDDLTVRELLTALQTITTRAGRVTENRRLSFRTLDVEQIGFVYEGLLDHSALRADGPVLGLVGKAGREPELPLHTIEAHATQGQGHLVAWLVEQTGRAPKQVTDLIGRPLDAEARRRLLAACENDATLLERVTPYAALLREDLRGLPTVVPDGGIYVTEVSHRRDTGTEYTAKSLADEVVRYALEPLVYHPGPAQGAAPADWVLKPSAELLALTVCDPAVGSGAILVAACRYLADRLLEAWAREGIVPDGYAPTPGGSPDEDELVIQARRAIADRCLFAVDRDPMAVEMAKLSLWLTTLAKDRPFTFLDHALQAGDSLLGVTTLDQVIYFHLDPATGRRLHADLFGDLSAAIRPVVDEAIAKRRQLESLPVRDVQDAERKATLDREVTALLAEARTIADLVVGAGLASMGSVSRMDDLLSTVSPRLQEALGTTDAISRAELFAGLTSTAQMWLNAGRSVAAPIRRCLHWPLAFPEVSDSKGFAAMVANPPYMGNKYWKERVGSDLQPLYEVLMGKKLGKPDLVVLFLRRMVDGCRPAGTVGSLSTQSLSEVASRELFRTAVLDRCAIYRAVRSRPWPGTASVVIAQVWMSRSEWSGHFWLDDRQVLGIDAGLTERAGEFDPKPLTKAITAFQGVDNSRGLAFVVEAGSGIFRDESSRPYFRPYISGEDLTEGDPRSPRRYVLDLTGLSKADLDTLPSDVRDFLMHRVAPTRTADELKPYKGLVDRWWTFWNTRENDYKRLRKRPICLVMPAIAQHLLVLRQPTDRAYTNQVIVFDLDRADLQSILLSSFFDVWFTKQGGTYGSSARRMKIAPVCGTFPLPAGAADAELSLQWQRILEEQLPLSANQVLGGVNSPNHSDPTSTTLRDLKVAMDKSTMAAYRWSDLYLGHGFHETSQGVRWTISPAAQMEVLDRLLELNHARYAEEVARGLHAKAKRPAAGARKRRAAAAPPAAGILEFDL